MRIIALIFILNLLCGKISAQQIYFSNNYGIFNCNNTLGSVVQRPDSGYFFVTNNYVAPYGYSVVSTNKYGDTLFTKSYLLNLTVCGVAPATHSLIGTQDGNYIACGSLMDTSNNRNGYVVKFSPNGDTIWTRLLSGSAFDVLNSLYEDGAGVFWICGSTWSAGNGQGDCWLVRMDTNGNIISDTTYGTAANETALCAELTTDGGFIMSGYSGSCPYVVKLNSLGGLEWQYSYCNYNGFGFVSQLNDSEYVVACCKILSAAETQACLIKLNAQGEEVWYRYFGFPLNEDVLFGKPVILPDGIVVTGTSTPPSDYPGSYLAKADLNGYMVWQRRYTINPNSYQETFNVIPTSDNGFLISGYCYFANQDAWLLKVDSMGCDVAGCDGVGIIEPTAANSFAVFPNPTNGNVTISSSNAKCEYVELVDALGQVVERIYFNSGNLILLSTENYAEGIYFARFMSEGLCVGSEKLMIIK